MFVHWQDPEFDVSYCNGSGLRRRLSQATNHLMAVHSITCVNNLALIVVCHSMRAAAVMYVRLFKHDIRRRTLESVTNSQTHTKRTLVDCACLSCLRVIAFKVLDLGSNFVGCDMEPDGT